MSDAVLEFKRYNPDDISEVLRENASLTHKKLIDNYNSDALEVRTDKGTTILRIKEGEVTIVSDSIKLGDIAGLRKLIDERLIDLFNNHTHLYNPGHGSSTPTGIPVIPLIAATCATTNTEAL